MAKNPKKTRRGQARKESQSNPSPTERGFDFGHHLRVISVSDPSFQKGLFEAGIVGCGYGYQRLKGVDYPIPSISLIGTNEDGFLKAYQSFKGWGCEEDGDVVGIELLLRSDGSYDFWVGPELERTLHRTVNQPKLFETLAMQTAFIKHLDTTNRFIFDLIKYCESDFHPIAFSFAIGEIKNLGRDIRPPKGCDPILKFELKIIEQSKAPDDHRFSPIRSNKKGRKIRGPKPIEAIDLCRRRRTTLDLAFPVSRERVLRSGVVREVLQTPGFQGVRETQIIQAAINVMVSLEIGSGSEHYQHITGDYYKTIWDTILSRIETIDTPDVISSLKYSSVCHQIKLDVYDALKIIGNIPKTGSFEEHQQIFLESGLIDD